MIDIRCFGGISVLSAGDRPVYFRSRKHVALLLYLVSNRDRVYSRDELLPLLWDSPTRAARHSLSQALYDLKRRLGQLSIERFGDGLRLAGDVTFEGRQFEDAVKGGDLRAAVELYRGDFAAAYDSVGTEEFERWVDDERRRYAILAQAALHRYVRECDGQGDWGQMCIAALQLVKLDPLSQGAHRSLMRAFWLHGDQAAALRHFGDVEESLAREMPGGISSETHDLVQRIRSSAPPVPLEITRGELPMVGRDAEFGRLRGLVDQARRGGGAFVVIRGEAGIGKTRLISELVKCASVDGLRLMKSRCYAAEENVAYGPVLDALQPFAEEVCSSKETSRYPHLRQLLRCDPERPCAFDLEADLAGERRRLYEEIVSLATGLCDRAAILWVVDDVHWIDASSASVLSYVVRRLAERPFLLLVTVRDGAELSEACLRLLQERSTDQVCATVALGPLSRDAIRSLVAGFDLGQEKGQLAEKIHRLSGGNPFLALEFLRGIGSATSFDLESFSDASLLSDRVTELLQARLQGLAPSAIRLLEAVAVLGRNAIPRHAADAADLSLNEASDVSEELYARGILRDREGRIEFVHDITREFIYGNVGGVRMASLHLFVAEALASDVTATLPTIARHFHLGGDRARAFEYALRAATSSIASFGHEEAKAMATLALSQAASDTERHEALDILGRSAMALGQLAEAEQHFREILDLQSVISARASVKAKLMLGRIRLESSDWQGAKRLLERLDVSALQEPADRIEAELDSLALLLQGAMRQLDATYARRVVSKIREAHEIGMAEKILTSEAVARSYHSMAAYSAFFESAVEADRLVQRAREHSSGVSDELATRLLLLAGLIKSHRTQWDEAEALLQEALSRARQKNQVFETGIAWNNLAFCALEQGRWHEAEERCLASMESFKRLPPTTFVTRTPLTNLADMYFFQGFTRKAVPIYQEALSDSRPDLRPQMLASLGLTALQLGDKSAATEYWKSLCATSGLEQQGGQEQFKIAWLCGYMTSLSASNGAAAFLGEAAELQREINVGSHLKLLWLEQLLGGHASGNSEVARGIVERLRQARLGWFVSFSRRWLALVQATRRSS